MVAGDVLMVSILALLMAIGAPILIPGMPASISL